MLEELHPWALKGRWAAQQHAGGRALLHALATAKPSVLQVY